MYGFAKSTHAIPDHTACFDVLSLTFYCKLKKIYKGNQRIIRVSQQNCNYCTYALICLNLNIFYFPKNPDKHIFLNDQIMF